MIIKQLNQKPFFKNLVFLFKILGTSVFFYIFLSIFDYEELIKILKKIDLNFFFTALLLAMLSPILTGLRLNFFLKATSISRPYLSCLHAAFCGLALNLVIPARGGDIVKMSFLRKDNLPSWTTLGATALLERLCDVMVLASLGTVASLYLGHTEALLISLSILFPLIVLFFLIPKLANIRPLKKKLKSIYSLSETIKRNMIFLVYGILTSFLCWTINSFIMGFLLLSVDYSISYIFALAATPPSIIAGVIPISLWGIGTRDGALSYLLKDFSSTENIVAAGVLYTALVYWFLGLLSLPALLMNYRKNNITTKTKF